MKYDYTTNSHYLTYTFPFKRLGVLFSLPVWWQWTPACCFPWGSSPCSVLQRCRFSLVVQSPWRTCRFEAEGRMIRDEPVRIIYWQWDKQTNKQTNKQTHKQATCWIRSGSLKPSWPNSGLGWKFPASLFLNMRRILYQNACIAKLKTRWTVLPFLRLNSSSLLDHKSKWRISLIRD